MNTGLCCILSVIFSGSIWQHWFLILHMVNLFPIETTNTDLLGSTL